MRLIFSFCPPHPSQARSPSSSASTFNFIYGPAGREFPWDQFLSLPPADRGLIKQLRIQLEELEESREALLRKQRLLQTELEETQQTLSFTSENAARKSTEEGSQEAWNLRVGPTLSIRSAMS
nr:unnamed protein product [Spirometra erinaceieuropaei]